jgi:hypothetical protein
MHHLSFFYSRRYKKNQEEQAKKLTDRKNVWSKLEMVRCLSYHSFQDSTMCISGVLWTVD